MIQASHPILHHLIQSLSQGGWPIRLWVYLMPFSLLWVSSDLPFPFVTSKALLITLWALMGLTVMMFHRSPIRVTRFDLLLLISILLGLLTGFANGNAALSFYSTLERCNGVALQLMLFLYLLLLRNTKLDWRIYWSVVLFVSSIVWVDLLIRNGPHLELQVASLLGNEAYLAGFLMLSALASGWLGARMPNGWVRWLLYCLVGVQIAIAVLTHNRSAITSVLLAIALLYSVNFARKSIRRQLWVVAGMVLCALLLLGVFFLQSGTFHDLAVRWDQSFRTGSISTRLDLWLAAGRMFLEAPIFGAGFGNFLFVFNRHHPGLYAKNPGEEWVDNAHSLPFEMLATTGLVGTLPWIIMLVVLFVAAFRRLRDHPTDRWLFVALLACFIEQLFVINSIPKHMVQIGLMAYFTQDLPPVRWPIRWVSRCPKGVWLACRGGVVALCLLGVWHLALAPYHSFRLFNELRFDSAGTSVKKGRVEAYFSKPLIYTLWPKLLLVSDLEQAAQNGHPPFSKAYVATLIALMRKEVVKDSGNIKARVALGRLYLMSDPVAAEAIFERVARDAPNKPHSYYYLGFAQQLNGNARAAAASFRRCLDLDIKLTECDRLLHLSKADGS
ncbi:MAG TPA: O-antigen ligase domain-containing protein [Gammaproteobacteria bacterium]|nr:O-antigen ligase domain-containing protein [Gammaproteobacteria bacterium]